MDHDQRFKVLLQAFFQEFMQLFYAAWARHFDFSRVSWLDKEAFSDPPRGERRVLDLVARLPVFEPPAPDDSATEWLILVHVEIEAEDRAADLRRRIFDYWKSLRLRHRLPVLSIGFFLRVGLDGLGWDVYREELWGEEVVRFRYPYVGLPALIGEEYLTRDNVLAAALSVLMRLPEDRRLELGEAAWRRVESEGVDFRKYLLRECIAAYLPRNDTESQDFERRLFQTGDPGERAMTVHMFDRIRAEGEQKGHEKGRQEGLREALLLVLEKRFGPLPDEVRQRVMTAPGERLNELLDSAVGAASLQNFFHTE